MITREQKQKILERFKINEEKILISNILDKVYRFEKSDKIEYTNFLNLNEFSIVVSILNELKVDYEFFSLNNVLNKKVIFFIPSYIKRNNAFFSNYISVLKIIPNISNKLTHKDYMGAIYSLGLKNEMIGDIFAYNDCAYIFCLKNISEYITLNLFKVGNQEVKILDIPLDSDEILKLGINLQKKEYIVASLRADTVLATVYNLSRSEVKEKIKQGDLFINDRNEYYLSFPLKTNDIVSFKRCGKIKIGEILRKTKNNNIVLEVLKYI